MTNDELKNLKHIRGDLALRAVTMRCTIEDLSDQLDFLKNEMYKAIETYLYHMDNIFLEQEAHHDD